MSEKNKPKNFKIETLKKFLEAIIEKPKNLNQINLKTGVTYRTLYMMRNILLSKQFIENYEITAYYTSLKLTQKGELLYLMLKELLD